MAEGLRFLKVSSSPDDLVRQVLGAEEREERGLGMGTGDDRPCLYAGAVSQGDAGRPALR